MRSRVMAWRQIANYLGQNPGQRYVRIEKHCVEHPTAAGMHRSLGLPVGQCGDWRMPSPGCHGLHVREYLDHYTAHVDQVNPNCDLPGHLVKDTPAIGGGAAFGALVGLILGESAGAMLVGALLGGALGASATSADERAKVNGGRSHLGGVVTTGARQRRR
jgi:hypothetical protein